MAESLLEAETIGRQAAHIGKEKDALRSRRGELLREETACRDERHRASDRVHGLDLKTRELKQQRESLAERIEEEYQVRLVDIVATGASASTSTRPSCVERRETPPPNRSRRRGSRTCGKTSSRALPGCGGSSS